MRRENKKNEILNFCREYMKEHGYPPTIREITIGVNLKSTSTVHYYMSHLKDEGEIIGNEFSARAFCIKGARYVFDEPEE